MKMNLEVSHVHVMNIIEIIMFASNLKSKPIIIIFTLKCYIESFVSNAFWSLWLFIAGAMCDYIGDMCPLSVSEVA